MATLTPTTTKSGFFEVLEYAGESAVTAFHLASQMIAEVIFEETDPDLAGAAGIRDFLESSLGRIFARDIVSAIKNSGADYIPLNIAIGEAIAKWETQTVGRRMALETGAREGSTKLAGWIEVFTKEAQSA